MARLLESLEGEGWLIELRKEVSMSQDGTRAARSDIGAFLVDSFSATGSVHRSAYLRLPLAPERANILHSLAVIVREARGVDWGTNQGRKRSLTRETHRSDDVALSSLPLSNVCFRAPCVCFLALNVQLAQVRAAARVRRRRAPAVMRRLLMAVGHVAAHGRPGRLGRHVRSARHQDDLHPSSALVVAHRVPLQARE